MILKDHLWSFKIILKLHSKRASGGGYSARPRRRRRPMKPDSATNSHAERSCSGAGGAGAAAGRVVSGAAAEGRSTVTAVREQTRVM